MLASGRELAAFALSESGAGSNPRAIAARAAPDPNGGWRLRGTKSWSGPASWAGVLNVFVTVDASPTSGGGMTGFVLQQGAPGLRQGAEALTMGMRGMIQNAVHLDDAWASDDDLLGSPGDGMVAAHDAMTFTRLGFGVLSLGGMKRCAQLAHRYATRRVISTGRLLDNPVTLSRLSELTASITAIEALVARIAELLDEGRDVPVDAFVVCKTSSPEYLWRAADMLVQVLGGRGYMEPNIAPQLLRDARVVRVFEGPTETLNMFLGARALNHPEGLRHLILDLLGVRPVLERLEDAARAIEERCTGPTSPFQDRPSAIRFANSAVGEVATLAVLWAVVESERARVPTPALARAAEWSRLSFEEAVERNLRGCPADAVMLDSGGASELVSSYVETIGDVEQTLDGADVLLDPMLCLEELPGATPRPLPHVAGNRRIGDAGHASASAPDADEIRAWITAWLAEEIGIDIADVDPWHPFTYYGVDSVTAVTLAYDLQDHVGVKLSDTVVWNYSTIDDLSRHVAILERTCIWS